MELNEADYSSRLLMLCCAIILFAVAFAVGVDGWRLARMILMGELATILMGKAASKNWMSNAQ